MKVDGAMAARVEQAVREVFEKRFTGRSLPYEMARELVWLEQSVREHVIYYLSASDRDLAWGAIGDACRRPDREENNEGDRLDDSGIYSDGTEGKA